MFYFRMICMQEDEDNHLAFVLNCDVIYTSDSGMDIS
jgi:hypothetical protein